MNYTTFAIVSLDVSCWRETSNTTFRSLPRNEIPFSWTMDNSQASLDAPLPIESKGRTFLTLKRKIEIAEEGSRVRAAEGESFRKFARENNVDPAQVRRWIDKLPQLKQSVKKGKKAPLTMHAGYRSSIASVEDDLYRWFVQQRDLGLSLSAHLIMLKACALDRDFRSKPDGAKRAIIRRFMLKHNLSLRASTHEAQRAPVEVQEEARKFVEDIRPTMEGPHQNLYWIANMDQTPIFFSMTPKRTYNVRGARTVNVRTSSGSTIRVTCAATILASGDALPPYFVYKGKRGGRICREFNDYPEGAYYAVQERAWMDEECMIEWIDKVIKPWAESAPDGIVPMLLLDSYRCHLMSSVVHAIQDIGVEVVHVPGGCTGLAQPLDVGYNKPLKNRVRRQWEHYMIEEGIGMDVTKPPTRQQVAQWVLNSIEDIPKRIVQNAWKHGPYSYFPNSAVEGPAREEEDVFDNEIVETVPI